MFFYDNNNFSIHCRGKKVVYRTKVVSTCTSSRIKMISSVLPRDWLLPKVRAVKESVGIVDGVSRHPNTTGNPVWRTWLRLPSEGNKGTSSVWQLLTSLTAGNLQQPPSNNHCNKYSSDTSRGLIHPSISSMSYLWKFWAVVYLLCWNKIFRVP